MGQASRRKRERAAEKPTVEAPKKGFRRLASALLPFAIGAVLTAGVSLLFSNAGSSTHHNSQDAGHRTAAQLMALPDAELEKVDVVEMNVAVARDIRGLQDLDYAKYRQTVDAWTAQFRAWLPTVEHAFHQEPGKFHNDINFFRLGMLAQFLDQTVGVRYVEEQKQAQVEARKAGRKAEVAYTDPGHLLLYGLIDTKRGTCGTMPALHVAIGRRMGWPVGLACADSHYVCRYDDGKNVYNIEATDTGRGGFAAGSDQTTSTRRASPARPSPSAATFAS